MKFDELYHLKANSWQLTETPERKVSVGQLRAARAPRGHLGYLRPISVCRQKISRAFTILHVCSVISQPCSALGLFLLSNGGSNLVQGEKVLAMEGEQSDEWCTLKAVMQRPLVFQALYE